MVKNLPANAGHTGPTPSLGRSRRSQGNQAHALQQEKPLQRGAHAPQLEGSPHSGQLEKRHTATEVQRSQTNTNKQKTTKQFLSNSSREVFKCLEGRRGNTVLRASERDVLLMSRPLLALPSHGCRRVPVSLFPPTFPLIYPPLSSQSGSYLQMEWFLTAFSQVLSAPALTLCSGISEHLSMMCWDILALLSLEHHLPCPAIESVSFIHPGLLTDHPPPSTATQDFRPLPRCPLPWVHLYYGLIVCVSTKSICWSLISQCDGIWRWVLREVTRIRWVHESVAPIMGLVPLKCIATYSRCRQIQSDSAYTRYLEWSSLQSQKVHG